MEEDRAYLSRGSKSRNKVSVGEPAEGSVYMFYMLLQIHTLLSVVSIRKMVNKDRNTIQTIPLVVVFYQSERSLLSIKSIEAKV